MKCPRRSVVVDEVRNLQWLMTSSDFVDDCRDRETVSRQDRKPVQFFKDLFDMALTACNYHHICKAVPGTLKKFRFNSDTQSKTHCNIPVCCR